jgi:hypothetical protein
MNPTDFSVPKKEKASKKVKDPKARTLVAPGSTYTFFINSFEIEKALDGTPVKRQVSQQVKLTGYSVPQDTHPLDVGKDHQYAESKVDRRYKAIIDHEEGLLGCGILVDGGLAKKYGLTFDEFVARVEEMGTYGYTFTFLDDAEGMARVKPRMEKFAKQRIEDMDAYTEAIGMSNMVVR